jgi:hypothetical protein
MYSWFETEILRLGDGEYSALLIFLTGLGLYLLYRTQAAFRRYRFISGTATSKIRSASQGYVELKGIGEFMPGDVLTSPFTGSRCLWYQCTVEQKQKTGKSATWTNISDEISNNLFHLLDDTGECVIDPEDAHVVAESNQTWYGHSMQDRLHPTASSRVLTGIAIGGYRFSERLIRPASLIYALGFFRTLQNTADSPAVEAEVKDLLRQWKLQPHLYLSQFDFDANGKIDKQEWRAIHHKARQQVISKFQRQQSHNILERPQEAGQPFILSAVEEENLVSRKKLLSVSAGAVAFLLFIVIINLIAVRPPF